MVLKVCMCLPIKNSNHFLLFSSQLFGSEVSYQEKKKRGMLFILYYIFFLNTTIYDYWYSR